MWARKGVALYTCPKSFITPASHALVEEFFLRRRLGAMEIHEFSAKQVEAFALLERALTAETNNG